MCQRMETEWTLFRARHTGRLFARSAYGRVTYEPCMNVLCPELFVQGLRDRNELIDHYDYY